MAFDLTVWSTGLFAAGIGGLIGGTLGSYFRGYSTKKGENRAGYEDFPSLVKQEFAKAFEQEAGKRLATHQDVENVLQEVRTVTKETETIKTQIGSDFWISQKHWEQKRDIYMALFKTIAIMRVLNSRIEMEWAPTSENEQSPEAVRLLNEFLECERDLEATLGLARCFLSETAMKSLDREKYERQVLQGQSARVRRDTLLNLEFALVAAARDDLGVSPARRNDGFV